MQTLTDRGVPAHARRRARGAPGDRRRDRRFERAVRRGSARRAHGPDRDEPAGVAVERARVEGHRVPDREDRRAARRGLPAGRDHERHHGGDARGVRADARLRRGEDPAVRVREVPGRRPGADLDDEVGGRGHGDRAHVQGGARQGVAGVGEGPRSVDVGAPTAPMPWTARRDRHRGPAARSSRPRWRAGHTVEEVAERVVDRPVVRRSDRAGGRGRRRCSATGRCRRSARTSCARRSGWVSPIRGSRRLTRSTDAAVRRHREALGVAPVFKTVDTCAGEFAARTPYHYSTYEDETEVRPGDAAARA